MPSTFIPSFNEWYNFHIKNLKYDKIVSKLEWIKVDGFFDEITKIDDKAINEVIEIIKSKKYEPYDFNYVLRTLENSENWYIHEGDLTLDKSFASESVSYTHLRAH